MSSTTSSSPTTPTTRTWRSSSTAARASGASVAPPTRAASARSATGAGRASPASSPRPSMRLLVHVDGGARGNPGPAAVGAVVSTPEGEVLDEASEIIGAATNNVAEYRGVLLGLARARALGGTEVDVINDSELVARQLQGAYKVKHAGLKPLYQEALRELRGFDRWSIRSVPREQNAHAGA